MTNSCCTALFDRCAGGTEPRVCLCPFRLWFAVSVVTLPLVVHLRGLRGLLLLAALLPLHKVVVGSMHDSRQDKRGLGIVAGEQRGYGSAAMFTVPAHNPSDRKRAHALIGQVVAAHMAPGLRTYISLDVAFYFPRNHGTAHL